MREVEVYFKNENDAQSAEAELNKYRVSEVSVEEVPEQRGGLLGFIPFFSSGDGSDNRGGIPLSPGDSTESGAKEADKKYMSNLLRFKVAEEDYDEAISVLKKHDVYSLNTDNNNK